MTNLAITPMLHVADLTASAAFYQGIGFSIVRTNVDFDPSAEVANWMLLQQSAARLMLNAGGHVDPKRRDITLSFDVPNVDAIRSNLPNDVAVEYEPRDQFYGRRDFEVRDPSGFLLLFGQNLP